MRICINKEFIEKLLKLTKDNKINWIRLPKYFENYKNEPLRKYVIGSIKYFYSNQPILYWPLLSEYQSYCANIDGGVVSMLAYNTESGAIEYKVALQPSDSAIAETMGNCDIFQTELNVLYDYIEANGRGYKCFVDDILKLN